MVLRIYERIKKVKTGRGNPALKFKVMKVEDGFKDKGKKFFRRVIEFQIEEIEKQFNDGIIINIYAACLTELIIVNEDLNEDMLSVIEGIYDYPKRSLQDEIKWKWFNHHAQDECMTFHEFDYNLKKFIENK